MFNAPKFWYKRPSYHWSKALRPLLWLYQFLSYVNQLKVRPARLQVPVICVGNLVMGGAGKTPVTIKLIELLKQMGHTPHILTRGYGTHVKVPVQVNNTHHTYKDVGDEALLLAQHAPTWVCPDRVLSAKKAIENGATILVMDDGFQNPTIAKDFNILVVDGLQQFGNQQVFPEGPLRQSISLGLKQADLVVLIRQPNMKPISFEHSVILQAKLNASVDFKDLSPAFVIGFCGLGFPEKFKCTLIEGLGLNVIEFIEFPDHHPYTEKEIESLLARGQHGTLMTTQKDLMRIPSTYHKNLGVVSINLQWDKLQMEKHLCEKISSLNNNKNDEI